MPAGLQSVDSSFEQLHKEYIGYAQRKQALVLEVGVVVLCLELVSIIFAPKETDCRLQVRKPL